jgi:hypothetical protein
MKTVLLLAVAAVCTGNIEPDWVAPTGQLSSRRLRQAGTHYDEEQDAQAERDGGEQVCSDTSKYRDCNECGATLNCQWCGDTAEGSCRNGRNECKKYVYSCVGLPTAPPTVYVPPTPKVVPTPFPTPCSWNVNGCGGAPPAPAPSYAAPAPSYGGGGGGGGSVASQVAALKAKIKMMKLEAELKAMGGGR